MNFDTPTKTVLYSIEETIKAYRKLSQQNISQVIPEITVDQALILLIINHNDKTQSEIADLVFKDYASMSRIVKLMIDKKYLTKTLDDKDKRKARLKITENGKAIIAKLNPMIKRNRELALKDVTNEEIQQLYKTLKKITQNCQTLRK